MSLPRNFHQQMHSLADADADYQAEFASSFCESPIEVAFFVATTLLGQFNYGQIAIIGQHGGEVNASLYPHFEYFIWPQFNWRKYRIDFLFGEYSTREDRLKIAIECDGHDFHERTKEQAERDRSRDREMQTSGLTVLRFTGREIYRDPFACSTQAFEHILSLQSERNK